MATPLNSLLYQVLRRSETDVKYTVGQGPYKAEDKMGGDVIIKTRFSTLFLFSVLASTPYTTIVTEEVPT